MRDVSPSLAAHKGLRRQILLELKRWQPLTAKELADRHGVSANAVRRHLKELEAERLVAHDREQRGQGAPTYTYRLSPDGEALFPNRSDEALNDVLMFLARTQGRDAIRRVFAERFRAYADRLPEGSSQAEFEDRVDAVVELLSKEGFMAEWTREAGTVRIAERNCAVRAVASRFPEICAAEAEFLEGVLGATVERSAHIRDGCNACEYAVHLSDAVTASKSERDEVTREE